MGRIIFIETSTALCSVALGEDGKIVDARESAQSRSQASMTVPLINEMLASRGIGAKDCSAVCVSKGPGSYTGLRVGSSTAKGLCFGAGIPLIAVSTPEVLVQGAISEGLVPEGCRAVIPMIDARRMEVYNAVFSPDGKQAGEIEATVVETGSFAALLEQGPVLFIGDGADKCRDVLNHPNALFHQCCPRAEWMLRPAFDTLKEKRFENTAYFEPFYLKQFVATVSGRKLF